MVKEMIKKERKGDVCVVVRSYQCEKCGRVYETFDAAKRCEQRKDKRIQHDDQIDTGSRPYFLPVTPPEIKDHEKRYR